MKKLLLSWMSLGFAACVASPLLASDAPLENEVQDLPQTTKSPSPHNDEDALQDDDDLGAGLQSTDEELGLEEEDNGYESPNWDFVDPASPLRTDNAHPAPTTSDLPSSPEDSPMPPQNS